MSKHTPGPWHERIATGTCDREISGRNPERKEAVCIIPYRYGTPELRAANTRLITAAPELLKATRELLALAVGHSKAGCIGDCESCRIRADARAAIAKAEGA